MFPPRESIADKVKSGTAPTNDLFPPGRIYQAQYAACALQRKLDKQLRKVSKQLFLMSVSTDNSQNSLDETFLLNVVQHLDKALLNPDLISRSLEGRNDLHMADVLVTVLLQSLKGKVICLANAI